MPTLKEQSNQFHAHLQAVKREAPLHPDLTWYPWITLGQFDILSDFLGGDTDELLRMIGPDPVLDIGCGDGDISFFLESLGVQVNVVDQPPTNYNAMYGVRALQQYMSSGIGIHAVDVDAVTQLPGGPYGFAVMLGILYHLKNPYLVLETLAKQARYVFLSTRIAEFAPDRKTNYGGNPVAYLVDEDELNHDRSNYWIFTESGLKRIMKRAGWDILHYTAAGPASASDPVSPQGDARAYIVARSRVAAPVGAFRLTSGWHGVEEGIWQWGARRVTVEATLPEAKPAGKLLFRFYLPDPVFTAASAITLTARLLDRDTPTGTLLPVTYTTPGAHEYLADLPPLDAGALRIEFTLSSAIAPSSADSRELALQVFLAGAPPVTLL